MINFPQRKSPEDLTFELNYLKRRKIVTLENLFNINKEDVNNLYGSIVGDSNVCCLLDENCINIQQRPLGPKGKVGVPYFITYKGRENYVSKFSPFRKEVHYKDYPPVSLKKIMRSENIECMSMEIEELHYLGLDEFTNEMCIGYLIQEAFKYSSTMLQNNMYFGVEYINGSTCNRTGIHVMEYCDLGNLRDFIGRGKEGTDLYEYIENYTREFKYYQEIDISKFSEDVNIINVFHEIDILNEIYLEPILSQVTAALHYLNETIEFTSGDLKTENIFVKSETVTGMYGFLRMTAPFKCKIADYGKSSCTFTTNQGERLRIYNWSRLADYYLKVKDFTPKIRKENTTSYYIVDEFFMAETYVYLRHMGIPYYRSFDYYTFLISLLVIPEYYYSFFNSSLVYKFWDRVWINEEENQKMRRRVFKAMRNNKRGRYGYDDIVKLLKGRKLMCSAIKKVVYQDNIVLINL